MKTKFFTLLLVVVFVAIAAVPALPANAQDGEDESPSIAEIVVAAANSDEPEFTVLLAAVEAAGLTAVLDETGPYTVFAPTDAAFVALLDALGTDAETLLADTELLTSVLLYHVVPGTFYAEDVAELDSASIATAFWGSTVDITVNDEGVFVDGASVVAADIEAANGVIHVIDSVIVPSEDEGILREFPAGEESIVEIAAGNEDFSTLVAAVLSSEVAADYLTNAQFVTVFAPTNDAFAALLEALGLSAEDLLAETELVTEVLAYHVVPFPFYAEDVIALDGAYIGTLLPGYAIQISLEEDSAYADDAEIIAVDIEASNGIIHVIDSVLIPDMGDDME
jgi:uncharacterized surface protein with fasciclin (FAS1) repeats